jgi:hypothetical protein
LVTGSLDLNPDPHLSKRICIQGMRIRIYI